MRIIMSMVSVLLMVMLMMVPVQAKDKYESDAGIILYVPHDGRPISSKQTAAVAEKLGYEVMMPPTEILGGRDRLGDPNEIWAWLEENANAKKIRAMVLSTDSLIYGSLVGSRKHDYESKELLERATRFEEFHKDHKNLPIYAFGSIMRTPRTGALSGHEEPEYYRSYGADIFRYTALIDKAELDGLNKREKKEKDFLERLIPREVLSDWMERRKKNFDTNKELIDLAKGGAFKYLLLGRDDNAPYCQTHLESRYLTKYGAGLGRERFQSAAGIDEMGLILITRAINERENRVPQVHVKYNWGRGAQTVPIYSDETIEESISSAVRATGGLQVPAPERADFVLMVNTNPNGKTLEAGSTSNDVTERDGTKYFADMVEDYVGKGYRVAVSDIAYANGSDNALMETLRNRGLLFRLIGYAGWNTATNSTGFVLSMGMLSNRMSETSVDELLVARYLDDWAYQANVRNIIARQLTWLRGDGYYGRLGDKESAVSDRTTRLMERFIESNLPPIAGSEYMKVVFPWGRMFESDVLLGKEAASALEAARPHIRTE